jgi:hypothetical protein
MKIFENGLDHLLAVIEDEVFFMFTDAEEIGSSDISCCVRNVLRSFYDNIDEATNPECVAIRNGINNALTTVLRK